MEHVEASGCCWQLREDELGEGESLESRNPSFKPSLGVWKQGNGKGNEEEMSSILVLAMEVRQNEKRWHLGFKDRVFNMNFC